MFGYEGFEARTSLGRLETEEIWWLTKGRAYGTDLQEDGSTLFIYTYSRVSSTQLDTATLASRGCILRR